MTTFSIISFIVATLSVALATYFIVIKMKKSDAQKMAGKKGMMRGGMANGKPHMYSAGGSVTDNLPNKGLRRLARTDKGRQAVRNMGFDV